MDQVLTVKIGPSLATTTLYGNEYAGLNILDYKVEIKRLTDESAIWEKILLFITGHLLVYVV